ncbi:hypothetical protein L596_028197 [Steinernema carpocapsae]|uniref:Uncharacterized protein n=1 Tax=Steinernema carpocapsae TaxID=34508 RepID=A0A4U5LXQ8_STECR|nr:hypothetical protein L596_028197 [Steinernema carpocapsae]
MCIIKMIKTKLKREQKTAVDSSVQPQSAKTTTTPSPDRTETQTMSFDAKEFVTQVTAKFRKKPTPPVKDTKSVVEMKKGLVDAQKALGRKPNTTIIDRMVEREKVKEKSHKSNGDSTRSRKGDISFVLVGSNRETKSKTVEKKTFKDTSFEDTQYPEKAMKAPKSSNDKTKDSTEGDEELVEDVREVLDEENWMRNDEHIYRTCHDNIRELQKGAHACFVHKNAASMEFITKWDRFASLQAMESREVFTSNVLEIYTFISATETMDDKEKKAILAAVPHKKTLQRPKPTFQDKIQELMKIKQGALNLKVPISEDSYSLNKTMSSAGGPSSRSRSRKSKAKRERKSAEKDHDSKKSRKEAGTTVAGVSTFCSAK